MDALERQAWIDTETYLAGERQAHIKHEYVDGQVYAMAGTSFRHNEILLNLVERLRPALRQRGCRLFGADIQVHIEAANCYYYPDLVVTCDPTDTGPYICRSPLLIGEILSDPTARIDHHEKRARYQLISSLQELLLIAQEPPLVEIFRRGPDGTWQDAVAVDNGILPLRSVGLDLPLAELYA